MPELPEVETIKRDLQKEAINHTVEDIKVFDPRVIKDLPASQFIKNIKGRTIKDITRRGKSIIFSFDNGTYLFVQLKMTGFFTYGSQARSNHPDAKVVFTLSEGKSLHYNDQRTLGWLVFTKDLRQISYLATIGPEPLGDEFAFDWLRGNLKKRKAPIKNLLMNQHFVAGIGNIYASEILFQAGIKPQKQAARLTRREVDSLHKATVDILTQAVQYRGTSMRNYRDAKGKTGKFMNRIKVYGKSKQPCPVCSQEIERIVQAGRSTFYCPACQK